MLIGFAVIGAIVIAIAIAAGVSSIVKSQAANKEEDK
jgi:hypothetical protein